VEVMKRAEFTMKEIWDAAKGDIHKSKKKYLRSEWKREERDLLRELDMDLEQLDEDKD
jgi:hypothetical protein